MVLVSKQQLKLAGYHFDSDSSCTCVPLGENASTLLEILVLVLVSSCLLLGYGSLQLLRRSSRNVGLDQRKSTLGVQSLSELRTLFSQSSSRNPSGNSTADSVNGDSAASVSSSSNYGLMRPRAKTFSFFPLRGYEELPEDPSK